MDIPEEGFSRSIAWFLIYMWQLAHNRAAFVTKHLITSSVSLTLNVLMRGSVITCSWPSHPFSWVRTPGLVLPKTASTAWSQFSGLDSAGPRLWTPPVTAWWGTGVSRRCWGPAHMFNGNHLNNISYKYDIDPTGGWQIGRVKVVSASGNVFHLN